MKIVTNFNILLYYARELARAEKSEDPIRIAKAQAQHDAYKELCLSADRMDLGVTVSQL